MTTRSKIPAWDDLDRAQYQYLDTLGRRQEAVAQLEPLSDSASDADVRAVINAIIEAHRTK